MKNNNLSYDDIQGQQSFDGLEYTVSVLMDKPKTVKPSEPIKASGCYPHYLDNNFKQKLNRTWEKEYKNYLFNEYLKNRS